MLPAMSLFPAWTLHAADGPLLATAIHHGHVIRPEIEALTAIDEDTRLREEDPFTGRLAAIVPNHLVVHRSRFEVDLNRPRDTAVYLTADQAWGLQPWHSPPSDETVDGSLSLYDGFYRLMAATLETMIDRHGRFIVLDIHSYNHRRNGPEGESDDPAASPTVNVGTGTVQTRWRPVIDAFMDSVRQGRSDWSHAGENVRFRGGHFPQWINARFGEWGCALAIECKKVFMDEWSGTVDDASLQGAADVLAAAIEPVTTALEAS